MTSWKWLESDADLSLLKLPGYNIIHQGFKCTKYEGRNVFPEVEKSVQRFRYLGGLFIDETGHNLRKPLTIWNIYQTP